MRCGEQFFPQQETELFCEDCLTADKSLLNRFITEEHFSDVPCLGKVVAWENRVGCSQKRNYYNYNKVYKRDNYICQYCGYNPRIYDEFTPLSIDHIIPHSYGGTNSLNNLVVSCMVCNNFASNKIFASFEDKRKYVLKRRLDKDYFVNEFLMAYYELF